MAYANSITFDINAGLKGTEVSGTYKSYTLAHTLSWNVQNVQSLMQVFGMMQSDMQRCFDNETPGGAERVATDWRNLVAKAERSATLNALMVTDMYNQVNVVLKRGYEVLGQKYPTMPSISTGNTPETVQQPGIIYTSNVQPIPSEMLEPPAAPAPTGGATAVPGTAKTQTILVSQESPTVLPSGPGGGIVHAEPAAAGIPWKWIALGLGALYLLKRK